MKTHLGNGLFSFLARSTRGARQTNVYVNFIGGGRSSCRDGGGSPSRDFRAAYPTYRLDSDVPSVRLSERHVLNFEMIVAALNTRLLIGKFAR
ncbi:hypothetical protein Trydic_g10920 [Trypoxylus dichotomus]